MPADCAAAYLERYDPINRKRVLDLRMGCAGLRGAYRLTDVAPGTYRILATLRIRLPVGAR